MEFLDFIKTFAEDVVPGIFGIAVVSLVIFGVIVILPIKTWNIVKQVKWLWYIQSALLLIVVLGAKSIILSALPLEDAGRETVEQVAQSVTWLLGAFLAGQALTLFVWEGVFRRKYQTAPPGLLTGLATAALYVAALYGIMTFVFERPMTGFIVSSGIVAGVLGLAMQNSLADLVAGIAISIERPFSVGDWVELDDGTLGEVVDVNWRATHFRSWNSSLYIVPNARISNARVHNFNRPEAKYGHWFDVHVPSTVPPTLVRRVLLQAAVDSERVHDDPAPLIRVSGAGGSYKYMIYVHFDNYQTHFAGIDDLLMQVWIQCARHGIVPSAVTSEVILRRGVAEEIKEPSPHDLLAEIELFAALDEESRRLLVGGMKLHAVRLGNDVVRQGDEGSSLFVVSVGMVDVTLGNPGPESRRVARLGAGEYFGEMSLLAGEARMATVTTHTDCQLLEIDKDALKPVFDRNPELMQAMARIVTERKLSNEALENIGQEDDLASRLNALAASLVDRMKKIFA